MTHAHTTRAGRSRRLRTGVASAAVLTMVGLAACSGDGDVTGGGAAAMASYAAGDQFTAAEPVEFSILWTDWPNTPITDSWEFFDVLEEMTAVRLTTTNIPLSDHTEKRSLLISAGDAPQIIPLVYAGEEKQWAASGAVLPMSDYIEYMPHFQKYADEWDLWDMLENLKQEDGKYYMLPGFQEISVPTFTLLLRKDVFEEVGYTEIPDDWDGLRDAFRAIKAAYPDSYPLQDGFEGQSLINYASRAFGSEAGWGFGDGMQWDEDAGELIYAGTSDGYKAMVDYFRQLVDEGLLDPDSFTTKTDAVERVERMIANEQAFAGSGAAGTLQEWSVALNETVGEGGYELVQVPPPAGPAGAVTGPRGFWHGFALTADAADSPDFTALLQFLDWLYYSPQAQWFLRWGVEGQTYDRVGDDVTLREGYSLDQWNIGFGAGTDIQRDLGYSSDVLAGGSESRALKASYQPPAALAYTEAVLATRTPLAPRPPAPLSEAELEQASLLSTPLKDTVDTNTLRFILGQRPMSEWDAYVSELEGQGLQSYVELVDGARQRFADTAS